MEKFNFLPPPPLIVQFHGQNVYGDTRHILVPHSHNFFFFIIHNVYDMCHNLNFGLVTKTRAWKGVGRKYSPGVTFTFPGVWESLKEWTYTLPNGLPFRELESQWTSKSSNNDLKGQSSLDWKLPYTIENFLRCRCLKWAHMIHLNTYNTSYGQKKGKESKCQFDSRPLKVRNRP